MLCCLFVCPYYNEKCKESNIYFRMIYNYIFLQRWSYHIMWKLINVKALILYLIRNTLPILWSRQIKCTPGPIWKNFSIQHLQHESVDIVVGFIGCHYNGKSYPRPVRYSLPSFSSLVSCPAFVLAPSSSGRIAYKSIQLLLIVTAAPWNLSDTSFGVVTPNSKRFYSSQLMAIFLPGFE